MYNIAGYAAMIHDAGRIAAFQRAIQLAVKPGSIVADIGTGLGIFAFLACQAGARKVYAIEPSNVIVLAKEMAAANGFQDRIEFIAEFSTSVNLPEQVDVIVSDLSGAVPIFQHNLTAIRDARTRFLKPHGILIPQSDTVWTAVVSTPETHAVLAPPVDQSLGLNMQLAWKMATNRIGNVKITSDQLVTAPQILVIVDYYLVEDSSVYARLKWDVSCPAIAHGISLWFERTLVDGVYFSTAPGTPKTIYGELFLPWPEPVPLEIGDIICAEIRADLVGDEYIWSWNTEVSKGTAVSASFRQSEFLGEPLSPDPLRKQATRHVPRLNEEGECKRLTLELMDGSRDLEEIARAVQESFVDRFRDLNAAITYVGKLARNCSV